jgi:hypothetical protein
MPIAPDDAHRAGRLLQWGLRPRCRPSQEPEYRQLLDRYLDRDDFRAAVREFARGLGVRVLDAGDHGLVLGPAAGSAFALKPAEFRPSSSAADDRLLDGLVQLAIAATVFPRARDLEEAAEAVRPAVTVDEVEAHLRRLCGRLAEERRDLPDAAADGAAGLEEAWRVYHRRVAALETRDARKARRTTRRIIEVGLERLREFGCFTKEARVEPARYQPTRRYRVLVGDLAATAIYDRMRRLLNRPEAEGVKDPAGDSDAGGGTPS